MATDTRYVASTFCTWHGPIAKVGIARGVGIPCCPTCGSPLLEWSTEAEFMNGLVEFEKEHPGYSEFLRWLGTLEACIKLDKAPKPSLETAAGIYRTSTGKDVKL